jgi:hypothetical protein
MLSMCGRPATEAASVCPCVAGHVLGQLQCVPVLQAMYWGSFSVSLCCRPGTEAP